MLVKTIKTKLLVIYIYESRGVQNSRKRKRVLKLRRNKEIYGMFKLIVY